MFPLKRAKRPIGSGWLLDPRVATYSHLSCCVVLRLSPPAFGQIIYRLINREVCVRRTRYGRNFPNESTLSLPLPFADRHKKKKSAGRHIDHAFQEYLPFIIG